MDAERLLDAWIEGVSPGADWSEAPRVVANDVMDQIPDDAGIRGLYFNGLLAHAQTLGVALPDQSKVFPFGHKPMAELLRLGHRILDTVRPEAPMVRRLKIIGRWLFEYWSTSAVGKPMVASAGNNVRAFVSLCAPGYRVTFSRGRIEAVVTRHQGAVMAYEDVVWGADTVQLGIYDAFCAAFGMRYDVRIKQTGPASGLLLYHWWPDDLSDFEDADLRMATAISYR